MENFIKSLDYARQIDNHFDKGVFYDASKNALDTFLKAIPSEIILKINKNLKSKHDFTNMSGKSVFSVYRGHVDINALVSLNGNPARGHMKIFSLKNNENFTNGKIDFTTSRPLVTLSISGENCDMYSHRARVYGVESNNGKNTFFTNDQLQGYNIALDGEIEQKDFNNMDLVSYFENEGLQNFSNFEINAEMGE